ncbi:MAG: DegT/DnrJ/EryC1/StrS family aminotransferase [Hyphomicrobiaceae bacterium]|nr:DegT/DnrJ/EryC1/StrS family aminotransferase [Hyphomicrobiaceae bacterium]
MQRVQTIPFFDYPYHYASRGEEFMEAIRSALQRGAFIMQQDLFDFEKGLSDLLGIKHVIGVADGTMALIMSLRAAGVGAGDEVIVPSHTFVASAASIHHVGATPVLVECGADHLMDPASARAAVTAKTKAIMPVQLNGRVCDMDAIVAIADEFSLKIVEDSCQAVGARFRGHAAGSFGVAGTASFFPAKTLGCFGDGGAVFTNHDDVAETVRVLRDHGRAKSGKVEMWGYNSRLDNIQAAILNVKLKYYVEDIDKRRALARIYQDLLGDLDTLVLPPAPDSDARHFDIFQNYEIEADRRDELQAHLSKHGIGTIRQWGGHMVHQFEKLGFASTLPFTDRVSERYLLLPMHAGLKDEQVAVICKSIREFYTGA